MRSLDILPLAVYSLPLAVYYYGLHAAVGGAKSQSNITARCI